MRQGPLVLAQRQVIGRELLEKFRAFHLIGELRFCQFVIRRVGNRPGKVVKGEPSAAEIEQRVVEIAGEDD